MVDDESPHRRREDYVSFRDMVEYVAESDARYHAARAESLIQISNAMEKSIGRIETAVMEHEVWHRNVLQGYLDRAGSNKIAITAVAISAVATIVSLLGILAALHSHH